MGVYAREVLDDGAGFLLGHVEPVDRERYPSAHNYYLDLLYNFGLVGLLPLLALVAYTMFKVFSNFSAVWRQPALLGLADVVAFWVLVDNSLKVGLRQPYSGILVFFFWGVLLALIARPAAPAEAFSEKGV